MKKKYIILCFLLLVITVTALSAHPILALFEGIGDGAKPANLHTALTNTSFSVMEQGIARVYVDFIGYDSAVRADIGVTIQKDGNVIIRETYAVHGDQHVSVYEYPIYETGEYFCTVVYTVRGADGSSDVITFEGKAVCHTAAERVPEIALPTEELLLDQNGNVREKLLIEYDKNGARVRDTVYDAKGNKLAELRYHSPSPSDAKNAYYALGTLNAIKSIKIPRATADFTVWDANGEKLLSGSNECPNENQVYLTVIDGNDEFMLSERREYDDADRVILTIEYDEDGAAVGSKTYEYREDGYICGSFHNGESAYMSYTNDDVLQKAEYFNEENRLESEVVYQFDTKKQIAIPVSRTEYQYDPDGFLKTSENYNGEDTLTKRTEYLDGKPEKETEYKKNSKVYQQTVYQYQENGKLQKKTCYRDGRLFATWYPLKNSELLYVEYDEIGIANFVQYRDRNNTLVEQIRFESETSAYEYSTFRYDENGRMTEEISKTLYGYGNFFHDDSIRLLSTNYRVYPALPESLLTNASVETGRRTYQYGAHGLTEMSIYKNDVLTYIEGYAYRESGTVHKKTASHYQNNMLSSETVTDYAEDGKTPIRQTEYNRGRRILSRTYYDADGNPEIKTAFDNEIPVQITYYEYNENGDFLSSTNTDPNGVFLSKTEYTYGADGLLLSAQYINHQGVALTHVDFKYRDGKRVSKTSKQVESVLVPSADGTLHMEQKEITRLTTYVYDRDGFLTEKTERANQILLRHTYYQYHSSGMLNRMIVVTEDGQMTTDYDPYGIVTKETVICKDLFLDDSILMRGYLSQNIMETPFRFIQYVQKHIEAYCNYPVTYKGSLGVSE